MKHSCLLFHSLLLCTLIDNIIEGKRSRKLSVETTGYLYSPVRRQITSSAKKTSILARQLDTSSSKKTADLTGQPGTSFSEKTICLAGQQEMSSSKKTSDLTGQEGTSLSKKITDLAGQQNNSSSKKTTDLAGQQGTFGSQQQKDDTSESGSRAVVLLERLPARVSRHSRNTVKTTEKPVWAKKTEKTSSSSTLTATITMPIENQQPADVDVLLHGESTSDK